MSFTVLSLSKGTQKNKKLREQNLQKIFGDTCFERLFVWMGR